MPTQEVLGGLRPEALLAGATRRPRAALLDGGGADSWSDGRLLYSDTPSSTLEVYATGWGRWRRGEQVRWRREHPLVQWQDFLDAAAGKLVPSGDLDAAGILTVASYDLKHWIERLPRRHDWTAEPILYCALYDWQLRGNYRTGRVEIAAQSAVDLEHRRRWYDGQASHQACSFAPVAGAVAVQPTMQRGEYLRLVERAREYIAAGDIYQVNLAQRFVAPRFPPDGAALFAAWRRAHPMPFAAYVDGGDWTAVSNSPECFLTVAGRDVATFPIKGTLDRELAAAGRSLRDDPKERAEHVMIVDLERNDLGRVCEAGSVTVADLGRVQSYPLLQHMVSEVRGRLRPNVTLSELFRATFPGGSITGAPKIRAMQIIEELEPCARGLYTGAIGWSDLRGANRFNLAIRTAVLNQEGLSYHAGGGIVADSDPQREYDETLLKSEALFRALSWRGEERAWTGTATSF
jgi:para-aminobenzoate synthetase component 1